MKKVLFLMISAVLMLSFVTPFAVASEEGSEQKATPVYKFGPIPKSHVKLLSWYIDRNMKNVIAYEIEKKAPVKHVSQYTGLLSNTPAYGWMSLVKIKEHNYTKKVIGHSIVKDKKGRRHSIPIESYPIKNGYKIKTYRAYVRNYSVVAMEPID